MEYLTIIWPSYKWYMECRQSMDPHLSLFHLVSEFKEKRSFYSLIFITCHDCKKAKNKHNKKSKQSITFPKRACKSFSPPTQGVRMNQGKMDGHQSSLPMFGLTELGTPPLTRCHSAGINFLWTLGNAHVLVVNRSRESVNHETPCKHQLARHKGHSKWFQWLCFIFI